jgi:hypothetical protein
VNIAGGPEPEPYPVLLTWPKRGIIIYPMV